MVAGHSYRDMNGDARSTVITGIFKVKGEKGFSKITGKTHQLQYLDEQGDILALLEGGAAVSAQQPETPPAAAGACSTAAAAAETAEIFSIDEELTAILVRREAAVQAQANALAAARARSTVATAAVAIAQA